MDKIWEILGWITRIVILFGPAATTLYRLDRDSSRPEGTRVTKDQIASALTWTTIMLVLCTYLWLQDYNLFKGVCQSAEEEMTKIVGDDIDLQNWWQNCTSYFN